MFKMICTTHHPGKPETPAEFATEYREIYQAAKDLFNEYDICEIRNGLCWRGRLSKAAEENFCCGRCQHLTDTGCNTDSIWCKLWTCAAIRGRRESFPIFAKRLNELLRESNKLCHGRGHRDGLSYYIERFYGEKEYEKWKITETLSSNASSM